MAEVEWTDEAERRLRSVYDYIAEHNPTAASKVVVEIYEKVQLLASYPHTWATVRTHRRPRNSRDPLWTLSNSVFGGLRGLDSSAWSFSFGYGSRPLPGIRQSHVVRCSRRVEFIFDFRSIAATR